MILKNNLAVDTKVGGKKINELELLISTWQISKAILNNNKKSEVAKQYVQFDAFSINLYISMRTTFTKKRLKNVSLGFWNIIRDTIIFKLIPGIMSCKN